MGICGEGIGRAGQLVLSLLMVWLSRGEAAKPVNRDLLTISTRGNC